MRSRERVYEQSRNNFPISGVIGNCDVVPFGEVFVELDRHHFLEVLCVFTTGLVDFFHDPHDDVQSGRRFRFFDVVLGRLDGLQRDAFAGSSDVRKYAVFDRIIFRTVRWVMCDADFQF